jgi:hypothetical protein
MYFATKPPLRSTSSVQQVRAVRAALNLVEAVPKLATHAGSPLQVRVGIEWVRQLGMQSPGTRRLAKDVSMGHPLSMTWLKP